MRSIRLAIGLAMALVACLAHSEPVDTLVSGQSGKVEFWSSTPANRWTMARGKYGEKEKPIVVWGDLLFPSKRAEKIPAVVISHGSEGVSSLYYDVWAKAFLEAGWAVFVVDSQKPRGVERNLGDRQLSWNTQGNISDGLHALKLLSTHPDVDANKIFHIGFSRGAAASMASAWPIYQRPILPTGVQYAGNIAVYPGCNLRYHEQKTSANSSPILMLLGEKDDMTPAAPCVEYAQLLATEGMDVRYKVYPGSYHVFDRLDQPYRQFKEGTYAECSLDNQVTVKPTTDRLWGDYRTGEVFTDDSQFQAAIKKCGKEKWITVQSNPKARVEAVADVLEFIRAQIARK
jgi:dienelactone hydrolase